MPYLAENKRPVPTYLKVPKKEVWPEGFTTDGVSGPFPNAPLLWQPSLFKPWTWGRFVKIDLSPAAWWHDLRYWAGYRVSYYLPLAEIARLKPVALEDRREDERGRIDDCFVADITNLGVHPVTARVIAGTILQHFGAPHFHKADPIAHIFHHALVLKQLGEVYVGDVGRARALAVGGKVIEAELRKALKL